LLRYIAAFFSTSICRLGKIVPSRARRPPPRLEAPCPEGGTVPAVFFSFPRLPSTRVDTPSASYDPDARTVPLALSRTLPTCPHTEPGSRSLFISFLRCVLFVNGPPPVDRTFLQTNRTIVPPLRASLAYLMRSPLALREPVLPSLFFLTAGEAGVACPASRRTPPFRDFYSSLAIPFDPRPPTLFPFALRRQTISSLRFCNFSFSPRFRFPYGRTAAPAATFFRVPRRFNSLFFLLWCWNRHRSP